MDEDQQWLVSCLNASLDPNDGVRAYAEASLRQASLQAGFGVALARVAANRGTPNGLRQLAAVLLKQYIKKHWCEEDEEVFEHPVVSGDEKVSIRGLLLSSLDDPYRKICTAVSVAVSTIAQYDWPDDWPDLVPFLLSLINDQTKLDAVHGALRCLALLSADMDDNMVPRFVPALFPCLHGIVSSPQIYGKSLRSKALSIVYNCTSMLGYMSGVYKMETRGLILPMLQPWMDQFSLILNVAVPSEDPDDWSIRMEVLKCLNQFIQNFPDIAEPQLAVIVGPLWNTFVSSLAVYERSSIEGVDDSYDGRYDSDGSEKSLESYVIQLFEFLLTVVGSPKFVKVVISNIKELIYYTIGFLQMTEQQVHTWSLDANQYVADEDDNTYSCRVSGALIIEEIISSCGMEGINAVIDAAGKRISESQQKKDTGSPEWWRLREATLFALASVSDQLLQSEASGSVLGNMLEHIFTDAMANDLTGYPFLYARLFSSVPKFSSVINQQITDSFLCAAIKTVGMDVPPPVKVGACRALSQLLPDATSGIIQPHALVLFSSLVDLLKNASEETMHLVLETLQAAVKAGHEIAASIEPIITPLMLNMWASHVSDPFLSIDVLDVLEAVKNAPGCIHSLVGRVLHYIGPVLNNFQPQQQTDGLVAGSLDLVTMLLKNTPIDVVKAVDRVVFDPIIEILLQTDDHGEMQNATQCLTALMSYGRQDFLGWYGDPGVTMRCLLDVASRLLDPTLESSGALFVGGYILQLILNFPSHMAQHIQDLVIALIRRMESSQTAGLKSSLLLIIARLVHMSSPHVKQLIDLLVLIRVDGHGNSFSYVMTEWTQHQEEILGAYQIKVTTTALALLLLTRHVELENVSVRGHIIQSEEGIITTRSRSKRVPDQWTMLPLSAKILGILADALLEIQEQVDGENEDSDWEEVQNGDAGDLDFAYSAGTESHSRPTYEYLNALEKAFNEEHDDDYDDELFSSTDPLNEINLVSYLVEFLKKFSESDRQYFEHLFQSLTKRQQNAVKMVLKQ